MDQHSDSPLAPDKSAEWGVYQTKPVAQTQWEGLVRTSIAEITRVQPEVGRNFDLRPYIKDTISNTWLLVDSGAACTIMPAEKCSDKKIISKGEGGSPPKKYDPSTGGVIFFA